MKTKMILALSFIGLMLSSCSSGSESDTNGDGKISKEERSKELAQDGYLPMQPGRWKIELAFNEVDVPQLSKAQKQDILKELQSGASGISCLSAADASKPGADFFGGKGAEDCTYKKFDVAGNRVSMLVACGMGTIGKAEMDLDGTVGETEFAYDTKLAVSVPLMGKIKLAGKMTGKHDGKCQGNE
jgi:hypothetical protein